MAQTPRETAALAHLRDEAHVASCFSSLVWAIDVATKPWPLNAYMEAMDDDVVRAFTVNLVRAHRVAGHFRGED